MYLAVDIMNNGSARHICAIFVVSHAASFFVCLSHLCRVFFVFGRVESRDEGVTVPLQAVRMDVGSTARHVIGTMVQPEGDTTGRLQRDHSSGAKPRRVQLQKSTRHHVPAPVLGSVGAGGRRTGKRGEGRGTGGCGCGCGCGCVCVGRGGLGEGGRGRKGQRVKSGERVVVVVVRTGDLTHVSFHIRQ